MKHRSFQFARTAMLALDALFLTLGRTLYLVSGRQQQELRKRSVERLQRLLEG